MSKTTKKPSFPMFAALHLAMAGILMFMGGLLAISPKALAFLFTSVKPRNMGEQSLGYLNTMGSVWLILGILATIGTVLLLLKKPQGFPLYLIGLGLMLLGFLVTFQWFMAIVIVAIMVLAGGHYRQLTHYQ